MYIIYAIITNKLVSKCMYKYWCVFNEQLFQSDTSTLLTWTLIEWSNRWYNTLYHPVQREIFFYPKLCLLYHLLRPPSRFLQPSFVDVHPLFTTSLL